MGAAGVWRSETSKGWVEMRVGTGRGRFEPGAGTVIPVGGSEKQWDRVGGLALSIAASALIATSVLLP